MRKKQKLEINTVFGVPVNYHHNCKDDNGNIIYPIVVSSSLKILNLGKLFFNPKVK